MLPTLWYAVARAFNGAQSDARACMAHRGVRVPVCVCVRGGGAMQVGVEGLTVEYQGRYREVGITEFIPRTGVGRSVRDDLAAELTSARDELPAKVRGGCGSGRPQYPWMPHVCVRACGVWLCVSGVGHTPRCHGPP